MERNKERDVKNKTNRCEHTFRKENAKKHKIINK